MPATAARIIVALAFGGTPAAGSCEQQHPRFGGDGDRNLLQQALLGR